MFDDIFYVRFDVTNDCGYQLFVDGSPIYGKEVLRAIDKHYNNLQLEEERKRAFKDDIDSAYRLYASVCHICIIYDSFTDDMKDFLTNKHSDVFLCDYQSMSKRKLFSLFEGASIDLLYDVASHIFLYCDDEHDSHEEL